MLESPPPSAPTTRDKLVSLLDYIEQVVRLDERVAFALSEYKLADGKAFAIGPDDTRALPGVRHDLADEDGAVWLAVDRLSRGIPPDPPEALAPWLKLSSDPARRPELLDPRTLEVDEAGRLSRLAAGACPEDFAALDRADPDEPMRFALTLRLGDQPDLRATIEEWIATAWAPWAEAEKPRRRTIALYEALYRLLQLLEVGAADAPVEVIWGIGMARWRQSGRTLDRPLIERAVDLEIDDAAGGVIRVRPTLADAAMDLKPYEELGCPNIAALEDLARREIDRAAADDGLSPFRRDGFEAILAAAAVRLDPHGTYLPEGGEPASGLSIDAGWRLFARPRSSHVVLADIDRLKSVARDPGRALEGFAARLVTEPSRDGPADWQPLGERLGETPASAIAEEGTAGGTDVFFPKPFNDDQVAIVQRLARHDGLVVQGPPGTGKTHTIANLICHAMATGQRVLVVSRGESALAVLRDHLPEKVRPLAIALLSNERAGLRQVEAAVREIQSIVEGSRPEVRRRAIAMAETEIVKLRTRVAALDAELEALATAQALPMGPHDETPAALARRIAADRGLHAWFADRPAVFAAETSLSEADVAALAQARHQAGELIDHHGAVLPSPADLPTAETVAGWHDMMVRGGERAHGAGLRLSDLEAEAAGRLAEALDALARLVETLPPESWLRPFLLQRGQGPWGDLFAALCTDWLAHETARAAVAADAVELPPGLIDEAEACEAIERGAAGQRLWPRLSLGKGSAKALVAAVRLRGSPVGEQDVEGWCRIARAIEAQRRTRDLEARWRSLVAELGDSGASNLGSAALAFRLVATVRDGFARLPGLPATAPAFDAVAHDPARARGLAAELRQALEALRLDGARAAAERTSALFEADGSRTAAMARQVLGEILGRGDLEAARIGATWTLLLRRLDQLRGLDGAFATITRVTAAIAAAGAPAWARRLAQEPAPAGPDPLLPADWRTAWDWAAADALLARTDARARLTTLANQRAEAERNVARLFVDLVRERTFYGLERRLSASVKSALVQFVSALARIGKGTGKGAGKQRRAAQDALRRCYDAIPCWIMPTWRVSEQLPADLSAFDLVILDEASQSDVTELPAILRGRKILVVGDDRQVSPLAAFVAQSRIEQLRRRHLAGLPFQSLMEPGESLYTLMQAVFPDQRLMLKEHFRCVEPIIRFSMQFYPETLLPLRIPAASERLDPPLIDIHVPFGTREKGRRINRAEAQVIVDEIAILVGDPAMAGRSIGVISLIGGDQAELIRGLLGERIGIEAMQRHRLLCGDSATFQGNERDIVFLSMVADQNRRQALTMRRYEQRFNVAASRARDRLVLVRSVQREDLNPQDLKARLIAHFENPVPAVARPDASNPLARCESDFERDVLRRLLEHGYAAEAQVGALGFRIDMVVEGDGGRRLAVECDGDAFHGPDVWRDDMRRQRILERVGWQFWRCFASSFYRDPDAVTADLFATLARHGIEPRAPDAAPRDGSLVVEHRTAEAPDIGPPPAPEAPAQGELDLPPGTPGAAQAVALGDRVILTFGDGRKPLSLLLTAGKDDVRGGLVSAASPLGQAVLGHEADDEVEVPLDGALVKALVEKIERNAGV